jgi:tetratricopeptide (TPR) repeat protein
MTKTFKLLSLGHRGVGKTVFLASNCAEILRSKTEKDRKQNLWFECQDSELKENIEKLVDYTVRTGQYPPPTFKISDFCFSLKRKTFRGNETLCNFSWFDLPGELCNINNSEFQTILLSSHGCCVFIDAYALLHEEKYLQTLEQIMSQLEAIISLANQSNLKYPFSLICTKCDLIEQIPIRFIQLEAKLRPLTRQLDLAKAHYRRFYASSPILSDGKESSIQGNGATTPLLWLISELTKIYDADTQPSLGNSLNYMLTHSAELPFSTLPRRRWQLSQPQKAIAIALGLCGILGAIAVTALNTGFLRPQSAQLTLEQQQKNYEQVLQRDPSNLEALSQAVNSYLEQGQFDKAIAQLNKAHQSAPNNIYILIELASLYSANHEEAKEEETYDQILKKENDNVVALTGKATLRSKKGDLKTAKVLFENAIKYADTDDLKDKIKKIAQQELKP